MISINGFFRYFLIHFALEDQEKKPHSLVPLAFLHIGGSLLAYAMPLTQSSGLYLWMTLLCMKCHFMREK